MASMQPAAQLQFLNLTSCLSQPQPSPVHQQKVAKLCPQTHNDSHLPKEPPSASPSQQVPRLRAVVESQAFKNILVDEMDMMVSRAATVIQANWKGYRLRQKLLSQMSAAKAIQEAWRRFSTRRLRHSNKLTMRKAKEEEGDIPYHPPQQVRFHAPEDQPPVMVSKKIQFPSSDNLVPSHAPAAPGPCASRVPRGGLQPQQSVTGRHTGPKYQPSIVTKTVRSTSLIRHLEGDSGKSRHVPSKTIKVGTPDSAASGRYGSLKTQAHAEAGVPRVPPHTYPVSKTPTKVSPVSATAPKSPAAMPTAPKGAPLTCPTSPGTAMKMQSPTCPIPPMTRPLAHVRPNPSLSSTIPQVRSVAPMARAPPPGSAVTSTGKASPRLGAPINKAPVQTGPGLPATKTLPQTRAVTKGPPQTCAVSTPSKSSSQVSPQVKLSAQTRLAAIITKTPAQLRSMAAVLRTLCQVPVAGASSPRGSPRTSVTHGMANIPSQVHLSIPKAKVTVSSKQTTVIKVTSQSHLAKGKGRCGPHGHPGPVAFKSPARSPLEVEKMKPGPPRAPKKEASPRTNAVVSTRALSWTKVTEDSSKPLPQTQQKAGMVKVHSKVCMPEEMGVTLSQAQLAAPLTKTSSPKQPPRPPPSSPLCKAVSPKSCVSSGLATGPPGGRCPPGGPSAALPSSTRPAHLMSLPAQPQLSGEQARPVSRAHMATPYPAVASPLACSLGVTFVPPEGHLRACPPTSAPEHHGATRSSSQLHPSAEHAKTANSKATRTTGQVCSPTKLSKAPSLTQLITCLAKVPPQVHVPMGLTKAQSQAQLVTETAKCFLAAHAATELSSKPQSQVLSTSKASVQLWQHFGTLSTGPHAEPGDRSVAQAQRHSHAQNKSTQNPQSLATDTQGMLGTLMTPTGHPVCNAESWGDSGRAQTPPPPPSPTQSVSCHEDLAASIAALCADLVAMVGSPEDLRALLAKTLSQGEVRTALSQALSREVLGPSVVKALPQGMLGMALMKALSWGELGVSLSRALSRGELRPELSKATQGKLAEVLRKALTEEERATLSQALCQGELGAVFTQSLAQMAQRTGAFSKATSKTVGSRMTTAPASMELTYNGSLSVAWGPTVGPVQARCSKVRPLWEGSPWGQPNEILLGKKEGATLERPPCSPRSPTGSFSRGVVTSTYRCPLVMMPTQFQELYLRLLDLDTMACGEGPHVPKRPSQQPPPAPWQPLVANGAGPSSGQPPVTSSTGPSSHQPPVASRVSYPGMSFRDGSWAASKYSGGVSGGKSPTTQRPSTACQGNVCQCPNQGIQKVTPCGRCSPKVRNRSPSPKEMVWQVLMSGHRLDNKEKAAVSRTVAGEQHGNQPAPVYLNPKLQSVSSKPTPKQERHPQAPLTPSRPQTLATGHHVSLLDELVATLPQHPQTVLAKSYSGSSAACGQASSGSHSSLPSSGYSASYSTSSSLPPSEVLEDCREGGLRDPKPVLKEAEKAKQRPQGQLQKTRPAALQRPPLGLEPFLFHNSTSFALNVRWDSDSESEYSNCDLSVGLTQDTPAAQHRRSQVRASDQKPKGGVTGLDPAGGGVPGSCQAPEASEGSPCLSQQLEVTRQHPSSSHPAGSTAVSPVLAHPSRDNGASPNLTEPLMYYGSPTKFSQPFFYYDGSPAYAQQHLASGIPSDFIQTPITSLSNQAATTMASSSQAHAPTTVHGSPRPTQVSVGSWLPPGCCSMPTQDSGHTDSVPTSVAAGVSPNFLQPCVPYSMPSHLTQPCMATVVTPNYVQPPLTHSVSPSLAQPFVVSVMSPPLAHVSLANRAPPNLSQPTTGSSVVPGVLQVPLPSRAPPNLSSPYLAPRIFSNLPNVSVASLGALSLLPPAVVCGMGHGVSKPTMDPQQHIQGDSSTAQNQTSRPSPCAVSTAGQPSLGICGSPGDNPLIDTKNQPIAQDSTVHSESTQASKGSPSPMAQPTPALCQPPVASAENSGLTLGASVPCQAWFRGVAPGMPQGPLATGLYLSVCQGANPSPPMAAWVLPADVHWTQEQAAVAAGVAQGPCPAAVPSVQIPSELFPNQLGASIPQPCAQLPVTVDPQLLSATTVVPPSCQYAGLIIPDAAVCAVGAGLVQGSVDGKAPLALVPKPMVESETLNLHQVSVIRGVDKSVPPESTADGVAQSVPSESKAGGLAQNLPPESVINSETQSPHRGPGVCGVALSLPQGSAASGVTPSQPRETDDGEKLRPAVDSSPSCHAQGHHPSSVASGAGPTVPLNSVASSVTPGSMLVGISPRPYQAQSWKGPHVTSLSMSPEAQRVAQDPQPSPTVFSSDPQGSQDPGLAKPVAMDNLTLPKTGQIDATVFSGESVNPGAGLCAPGRERHGPQGLAAENVLKDQTVSKALLREEAPGQGSNATAVPEQGIGKHPTAKSITPVQSLSSESNSGPPSLPPVLGVRSLEEAPVDGSSSQPLSSNAPVAPQVSPGGAKTAKPQDHSKGYHQEPRTVKKPAPPYQGSLVSELLESSINRLAPSRPLTPVSQVSSDSHKQSSGPPTVGIKPAIRVGDGRGPKACLSVRKVSLGYESSPNGSQRSLNKAPQDTRHAGQRRTVLAPTSHQGQKPSFVTDPRVSYNGGSLASSTPHGQNVEYITSPETGYDGGSRIPTAPHGHKQHATVPKTSSDRGPQRAHTLLSGHRLQHIRMPKRSLGGHSQAPKTTPYIQKGHVTSLKTIFDRGSQVPTAPHGHRPHPVTHPKTGHNKISPPPTVPQGPMDAGLASSQSWNTKVPNTSVRGTARAGAPQGTWHPSRGHEPWDPSGAEAAALDRKPSAELLVSVWAMERVVAQAVVTIQACARGYFVRRTVKVWHHWATIIQATWRGYRVRRNLARLFRATIIIQAAWRSYCIRRARACQVLFPIAWLEPRGRAQGDLDTRNSSEHRCFLSCQPDICSVCQSLGPRVESTPSVVMLVGSEPRTCHVCGHTLSTRVVQGFGQGISVQAGTRRASARHQSPRTTQQHRAATVIQAAWRGYRTRHQLRQQQSAAKTVQATWRGHYTRSCLTTDALLGKGHPWNLSRSSSQHTSRAYSLHWPRI